MSGAQGVDLTARRKSHERAFRLAWLMDAAEAVFARKPFDEVTMREIAAAAELGMRTLYEHFPSKDALYEHLILQRVEDYSHRSQEAVRGLDDPVDKLEVLARVRMESLEAHPAFHPFFAREHTSFQWGCRSRFAHKLHGPFEAEDRRLKAIMEEALERGRVRPMGATLLVQLFQNIITAVLLERNRNNRPGREAAGSDLVMELFLQGAGASPLRRKAAPFRPPLAGHPRAKRMGTARGAAVRGSRPTRTRGQS